jgi:hypothetical protein
LVAGAGGNEQISHAADGSNLGGGALLMAKHAKTIRLIEVAVAILTAYHPMTVRQVYYQLVSRQS